MLFAEVIATGADLARWIYGMTAQKVDVAQRGMG
jgi:hypothetical protein